MHTSVFDLDEVEHDLNTHRAAQVQFDRPLTETLQLFSLQSGQYGPTVARDDYIARLRRLCDTWKENLSVRFYGFYGTMFDAALLAQMPEIRALTVNCIYEDVKNLAAIGQMPNLVSLRLGVFGLTDKTILSRLPLHQLTSLAIEETNTKALDLAPLSNAANLRLLELTGHRKNIDAIAQLSGLTHLVWNPAKAVSNAFLNGMPGLQSLKYVLGSGDALTDITDLPAIEDMALTMVRGMADLGDLQRFPTLRRLLVQDQPRLTTIQTGAANAALQHLWFRNCPALTDLHGLKDLPSLESLRAWQTGLQWAGIRRPASLTHAEVFSGKAKEQAAERHAIAAAGCVPAPHPDMPFGYK